MITPYTTKETKEEINFAVSGHKWSRTGTRFVIYGFNNRGKWFCSFNNNWDTILWFRGSRRTGKG